MFSSKDLFFTPASTGYTVSKSLRFRASATAYLNRTPSASNRTTWTWSGWVKRGTLGTQNPLFYGGGTSTASYTLFLITSGDALQITQNDAGVNTFYYSSAALLRDPSAWYHFVCAVDTTNATPADRVKLYVNGVRQTISASTNAPSSQNTYINSATGHLIGQYPAPTYFDGYMADVNFIDGSALTPSSFGAYDTNGVWQPAAYTGTYGTNGFYLKFTDVGATSGSNTGYGKDFAGTNYWTTNNFGTTSTATTYDSMLDSPTNATGGIGNYAVLNPALPTGGTYSEANLKYVGPSGWRNARASIELPSTGQWYYEAILAASGQDNTLNNTYSYIGITSTTTAVTAAGYNAAGFVILTDTGWRNNNGTTSNAVGAALAANDVIGIAIDVGANTFTFYRNNTSVATGTIGMSSGTTLVFVNGSYDATYGNFRVNFGQRPFAYTPPSGFSALNTQNLTTPTITNGAQYMAATKYTGTSASNPISNGANNTIGTTFQPDFVWIKNRSAVAGTNHILVDSVRGASLALASNLTNADFSTTGNFSSINADGFTVTGNATTYNLLNETFISWQWKAGGTGVTNTSGTITSTVSANASAGFSVVTYTGTGANATVGHGLGVAPSMVIVKNRTSSIENWPVWHSALANTEYLLLNSTAAKGTGSGIWNSTSPTSSTFSVGSSNGVNATTGMVAYCFAPVAGYSAFGSYTGNGSTDGPFVYTGFRPRFLLVKDSSTAQNWQILDTSRDPYNVAPDILQPNLSNAESAFGTGGYDFLSNGFKVRTNSASTNTSSSTIIYAAFAENPFKTSRAR